MWYIYILLCDQKTYYVGLSHNPYKRLISHKGKYNIATKEFSDLELVYTKNFATRADASKRETQLKKWSHAKKKALIEGDTAELVRLSKTRSLVEK